jgi:putative ABC transport system ATP-binding protein
VTDVLQAVDVHKTYGSGATAVKAVRGVSLTIASGELVAVIGPSGSGKSTLLHLLATLDRPDSGEIWIGGIKLSELDDQGRTQLRRSKIGLVFQFFNLLPLLSARENVALPLLLAGMRLADAEARADELLARVGLTARAAHRPDTMSGGEMQRVAVARALAPRPLVLLADEPTGNLDSASGTSVLALLRGSTHDSGCAVVMVTHDSRAAAVADRVLEFQDGTLSSG